MYCDENMYGKNPYNYNFLTNLSAQVLETTLLHLYKIQFDMYYVRLEIKLIGIS